VIRSISNREHTVEYYVVDICPICCAKNSVYIGKGMPGDAERIKEVNCNVDLWHEPKTTCPHCKRIYNGHLEFSDKTIKFIID
jgi:hypothetical protein